MDEQLSAILQEQLRDVHLPEPITWWPLAMGWWVLIVLAVLLIGGLSYYLIKRNKANQYRKHALSDLNALFRNWQNDNNDSHYLQCANEVLKRTVATFKRDTLNQSGQSWVATLNKLAKTPLSTPSQSALMHECYRANPEADIQGLHAELCVWLKQHKVEASHV